MELMLGWLMFASNEDTEADQTPVRGIVLVYSSSITSSSVYQAAGAKCLLLLLYTYTSY